MHLKSVKKKYFDMLKISRTYWIQFSRDITVRRWMFSLVRYERPEFTDSMDAYSSGIIIGASVLFDVFKTYLSGCRCSPRLKAVGTAALDQGVWKREEDTLERHGLTSDRTCRNERRSDEASESFFFSGRKRLRSIRTYGSRNSDVFGKRQNRKRVGDCHAEHPFPGNRGNFSMFSRRFRPGNQSQ